MWDRLAARLHLLKLTYITPPPSKPRVFAYAARSLLSHLHAQSRHSKSGKMYPFPAYHSPSPTPHLLERVGGDYSSYALPTGFQQIYHAQRMYQGENNGAMTTPNPYDPFTASTPSLATSNHATHQAQVNPYTQDTNTMGGASYYQGQNNFAQPVRLRIRHLRVARPKLNGSFSYNIIFMLHSAPTARICYLTKERPMISSSPMAFEKSFSGSPPQHCKPYLVCFGWRSEFQAASD